jgi:hypothetical protein
MRFATGAMNGQCQPGRVNRQKHHWPGLMGLLSAMLLSAVIGAEETAYVRDLVAWRTDYAQRLQGDEGWLTLVGHLTIAAPFDEMAGICRGVRTCMSRQQKEPLRSLTTEE